MNWHNPGMSTSNVRFCGSQIAFVDGCKTGNFEKSYKLDNILEPTFVSCIRESNKTGEKLYNQTGSGKIQDGIQLLEKIHKYLL